MKDILKIIGMVLGVIGGFLSAAALRISTPVLLILGVLKLFAVIEIAWLSIFWIFLGLLVGGLLGFLVSALSTTLLSDSL